MHRCYTGFKYNEFHSLAPDKPDCNIELIFILIMDDAQFWYIVKLAAGNCKIVPSNKIGGDDNPEMIEQWGPFSSQDEALARRVGLIRAGKCQPS